MNNNPTKIVAQCIDKYKNFYSYKDKGVVFTQFTEASDPLETAFSALFTRPNLFRFEFTCPHPYPPLKHISTRYVCGFDGERAYTISQQHEEPSVVEVEESLSYAIARSTGTSYGSVHHLAKLLLPNIKGKGPFSDLTCLKLAGEVEVEGESCYEIVGVDQEFGPTSACISMSDFTVLKYSSVVSGLRSEELRTHISLNIEIKKNMFSF